ncbi:MAG TPA: D-alanyl-D-alanine carboxypeptidase [Pyrinomonadaceae bacterium]|jgi:D-alanyl-D-alanine carboxypeptidase/D-alanyl-D-alanine-endopeptidase (penicillin-binding protein 4)
MIRLERSNSRRSVLVLLVIGIIIIGTLSLIPNALYQESVTRPPAEPFISSNDAASAASKLSGGRPEFDAASWYAERGEEPEEHGVMIESLSHDRLFASHNADQVFNPASLVKLATSLAALKKLGADYRFRTRVYAEGEVDNAGTLRGQLYVIGNDPTFGDVAAGLISNELRARGIKRIDGHLNVSPDFCFNYSESAEDSALRLLKALHLGDARTGLSGEPVSGLMFALSTYELRDVLLYMNAHSSNFVAERVGALVGGAVGVQQFLVDEVRLPPDQVTIARVSGREHNRMTPRGMLMVLRALVEETKRQGLEPADIMPVASDDSGTLRRRLMGTPLEGAVIAKTGTLTAEVDGGMASIAGIVYTDDAGMVLFAIFDQGNRIWDHRQMEDQLLAEVITTQARPRAFGIPPQRQLLPSSTLRIEKG